MRPVTKVNPTTFVPNYPFYTQASLNTNQNFNANSAISIAYSGNNFTGVTKSVRQMQDDLLTAIPVAQNGPGGNPFNGGTTQAERNSAVSALKDRLAGLYRPANRHLSVQLGDYCSFCEIYYPGEELDVEHRLAKAPYPTQTIWWGNFLQCCSRCNTDKGNRPSRAIAIGWTGAANPTEVQILTAVLNHYFWPDVNADSYRRVLYRLKDVGNAYAAILLGPAANLQNAIVSFLAYAVRANVQLAANAALTLNRRVEVTAEPAVVNTMNTDSITLTGLSRQDTARSGYRTRTWFKVINQINLINAGLVPTGGNVPLSRQIFDALWNMFLAAAQAFGHYSTIVTVLDQFQYPAFLLNPNAYATLANRFVRDTAPANATFFTVYAGTNTTQVP